MRHLRQEVGFGCPIKDCGSPYLEYHHFDPPWSIRQHHEPGGMIALCGEHHKKADGGSFPVEYLREIKSGARLPSIGGRFDWLLQDFVVVMGGAYAAQTWIPLAYGDRPVVSFCRDSEGFLRLNIDMPTASIAPRLRVWESNFYQRGAPKDFECPPHGRLVRISYKNGDYLRIEFRSVPTLKHFEAQYIGVRNIGPVQMTYPITAIEIELRLPEANLHINKDVFQINGNNLKNTLANGGGYFIAIGSHEPISRLTRHIGYSKKTFTSPRLRLASQNDDELIRIDSLTFDRQVLGLDGFGFDNCTFKNSRLMFSGKPFSISPSCSFPGSALILTDEAVTTCQALEALRKSDGDFDILSAVKAISGESNARC